MFLFPGTCDTPDLRGWCPGVPPSPDSTNTESWGLHELEERVEKERCHPRSWGRLRTAKSRSTLLFLPLGFLCVSEPRYTEFRSKESSKPAVREQAWAPGPHHHVLTHLTRVSLTHQVPWDLPRLPSLLGLRVWMHAGASLSGRVMGRKHSSATSLHQLHLSRPNFPSHCPARQAVSRPKIPLAQPRHGGLGLPGDIIARPSISAGLTCPTGCLYLPALCRKESR